MIFTVPNSFGTPLVEVNRCHGPGRGHPCTGRASTSAPPKRSKAIRVVTKDGPTGLAAEARKAGSFEEFERDYIGQIKHGLYWHITDNPEFTLDPTKGPRDMSSMADGRMDAGKLMITSHLENWLGEYPNRKHVALIDMSDVPRASYYQVNRGFGNEFFVSDPSKARVLAVVPVARARRLDARHHAAIPNSEEALRRFYQKATGRRA
jgi:hypothetical protein